jgi:hypothetical protein
MMAANTWFSPLFRYVYFKKSCGNVENRKTIAHLIINIYKSSKKRGGRTQTTTSSNGSNDGIQPDPRWADQLAQLKEMLAAANS